MEFDPIISGLDDQTAIAVLARLPEARENDATAPQGTTPELRSAIASCFAVHAARSGSSEGDLARQALLFLAAEDSRTRYNIHAIAQHLPSQREQYDAGATIAVTTAVLMVLQTYIRFERDKNGKWSIEIKKEPTSEELLKPLIEKLVSLLPLPAKYK